MARISNREIVQELKLGNPLGCSQLVEAYLERLVGEAVNVFHVPHADAEEIVSDAMLAVVEGIEGFEFKRSDGDFHLWVMTIFRNRVRDYVRHSALTSGLLERFDEAALDEEQTFTSTDKEVVRSILTQYEESLRENEQISPAGSASSKLQIIAEMLDRLETWERVLLRCRALDVPYEDIARYTGKTVKQLKVYHSRVKKKFMNLLAEHYPAVMSK